MFSIYYNFYCVYSKIRGFINYNIPSIFPNSITEVFPNIYIGNLATIYDKKLLDDLAIKNIISAVAGIDQPYPTNYNYLNIELIDSEYENIVSHFNKSNNFIQKSLDNNEKILIHCICGVSRSATLVIAYLLSIKYNNLQNILDELRIKRDIINPNDNFIKQLILYESKLNESKLNEIE